MKIQFLNNIALDVVSGGNIYNQELIKGLKSHDIFVDYNMVPANKEYHITIIDSLCMSHLDVKKLDANTRKIALIHQLPEISGDRLEYFKENSSFVVTGEPTKLKLINLWGVNEKNVVVIRPGVPNNWEAKKIFRDNPFRLILIANLIPNKGFDLLLDILKGLVHLDLECHIIGNNQLDSAYSNHITDLIKNNSKCVKFHFNLNRTQVYEELKMADLFLSVSSSESFGMSILEALSINLPCISYSTGDVEFFNQYSNYIKIDEYSKFHFIEIIEKMVVSTPYYKQYCKPHLVTNRTWENTTEEFSKYLYNQCVSC